MQTVSYPASFNFESAMLRTGAGFAINAVRISSHSAYPIVTVAGGISVVVPNFANGGLSLSEWAVYRFIPNEGWIELSVVQKETLLKILDDEKPVGDLLEPKQLKF